MVRWESVIIALFGTLLGIVDRLVLRMGVVRALHDQGFTTFSPAAGQLIVIVVLSAWRRGRGDPARARAAKLDVLRAIATE